jgi:DNA/RNA endonuclease YhcR with UshA esterase domain
MRSQAIKFVPGDQVEVLGSKFQFQGSDDLIARQIKRGNETFIFRDRQGQAMMVQ